MTGEPITGRAEELLVRTTKQVTASGYTPKLVNTIIIFLLVGRLWSFMVSNATFTACFHVVVRQPSRLKTVSTCSDIYICGSTPPPAFGSSTNAPPQRALGGKTNPDLTPARTGEPSSSHPSCLTTARRGLKPFRGVASSLASYPLCLLDNGFLRNQSGMLFEAHKGKRKHNYTLQR